MAILLHGNIDPMYGNYEDAKNIIFSIAKDLKTLHDSLSTYEGETGFENIVYENNTFKLTPGVPPKSDVSAKDMFDDVASFLESGRDVYASASEKVSGVFKKLLDLFTSTYVDNGRADAITVTSGSFTDMLATLQF